MTNLRQRLNAGTRNAKLPREPSGRRKTPEQLEEARRRIIRVCLTTAIGCALIGVVFVLLGSHTLHEMSLFMFGVSVGCVAAYVNFLIQRLVQRGRRSDER
jgi:hypothetical protein